MDAKVLWILLEKLLVVWAVPEDPFGFTVMEICWSCRNYDSPTWLRSCVQKGSGTSSVSVTCKKATAWYCTLYYIDIESQTWGSTELRNVLRLFYISTSAMLNNSLQIERASSGTLIGSELHQNGCSLGMRDYGNHGRGDGTWQLFLCCCPWCLSHERAFIRLSTFLWS